MGYVVIDCNNNVVESGLETLAEAGDVIVHYDARSAGLELNEETGEVELVRYSHTGRRQVWGSCAASEPGASLYEAAAQGKNPAGLDVWTDEAWAAQKAEWAKEAAKEAAE